MENQQQQNSPLCRAGCGFYGSPATEDLCSKCFKDMIKRKQETGQPQQQAKQSSPPGSTPPPSSNTARGESSSGASTSVPAKQTADLVAAVSAAAAKEPKTSPELPTAATSAIQLTTSDSNAQQPEAPKKPPNRCWECNKRVGLTGFECRCGGVYCGEHRYDTAHNCTYDYKTAGREELRKKHPQVVPEKVQQI